MADLRLILMGSGSELQHCIAAAEELGDGVRVVSAPCFERFGRQGSDDKERVLPKSCTKRLGNTVMKETKKHVVAAPKAL
jgi:transketolase